MEYLIKGLGGTTVLKQCIKENPNFEYIYYSDSKNNPYREKTQEEIICITDDIVSKLIKKECNIIIIACNTASCVASTYLKKISKYSHHSHRTSNQTTISKCKR